MNKKLAYLIILILISVATNGCIEKKESEKKIDYSQYIIPFDHELIEVKNDNNTTIRIEVVGQVKNSYIETLNASIRGHFLDKNNNELGKDTINQGINNSYYIAEPEEKWNFTLVYDGSNPEKIVDVVFTETASLVK